MHLDNQIKWSWWITFAPLFVLLVVLFLTTSSRVLSHVLSWLIRLVWCVWTLGFIVLAWLVVVKLQYKMLTPIQVISPLFVMCGGMFLTGIYMFVYGQCISDTRPARKRKYIVGGLPMLMTGASLTPALIMSALRLSTHPDLSWSICFIPLYIGDAVASCFSFFLLLFSIGGGSSNFSIAQLLSFELMVCCSIAFKILFALKVDTHLSFHYSVLLLPILIGEIILVLCGINLLVKPPKFEEHHQAVLINDSETISLLQGNSRSSSNTLGV
eukprot:gene19004-22749_t